MQFLSLSRRLVDKFPAEAFTPELMTRETARVRALYAAGTPHTPTYWSLKNDLDPAEPEVLRIVGEESKRNGTDKMIKAEIDAVIQEYRSEKQANSER